jgi:hypothetical protein
VGLRRGVVLPDLLVSFSSNSQRKAPWMSYCDHVSDHYDPRSSNTTRRFLRGTVAVSRALIIKIDHICHMLHSINIRQEST